MASFLGSRADSLHVVERVEERVDESGAHRDELGELGLEHVVVMLVLL